MPGASAPTQDGSSSSTQQHISHTSHLFPRSDSLGLQWGLRKGRGRELQEGGASESRGEGATRLGRKHKAKSHKAEGFIFLMSSEHVFYAHISGPRTRPRLRLRLRGGNHKKRRLPRGESALGIAFWTPQPEMRPFPGLGPQGQWAQLAPKRPPKSPKSATPGAARCVPRGAPGLPHRHPSGSNAAVQPGGCMAA